ncbi:DUF3078 domain-containing protein [Mesonia sp. K7]|uniref:DUF3078 domain-containing protein n=1 Tax=Mesonia sp. K7 TaxID=2218606 RepID=UPI000DA88118|nr:DUF3078 domain-containing protein [Mesonia sp. K7]PZD78432.1 hypothetical protein DNG35_05055 [Mesonia sp. K7]
MKKLIFTLVLALSLQPIFAQEEQEAEEKPDGWSRAGLISLLFNQTAFNAEWQGGGTSNYAGSLNLSYDANYKKGKFTWDNKVIADYGITKIKGEEWSRKTNDRFELNSIAGRQIKETNWYYSFFLNFRTQFDKGYEYGEEEIIDPATGDVIDIRQTRTETTRVMSPGYLQLGPGVLWKKSDNLKVNIAPATARFIFVNEMFTTTPGYVDGDYFGVDAGETTRFEFGAALGAYAKFDVVENVTIENILNLYSNYLEDPQNVDIDYTLNTVMKVNEFLSANFIFQAIYDDNAVSGFQVREVLGVGLTHKF